MAQPKKKPGRPKAPIDWEEVGKYLEAQCMGSEIAGKLGIDEETLYNRCKTDNNMGFSEFSRIKKSAGQSMLRASMYADAMSGDKTMKIWLSKQYLGMKDRHEQTIDPEGLKVNVRVWKKGDDDEGK